MPPRHRIDGSKVLLPDIVHGAIHRAGRPHFDGETIRQMGIAFEMALASLGSTPACDDPICGTLAQGIIVLAQVGERDPERLCEGALQAVNPSGSSSAVGGISRRPQSAP